MGQAITYPFKDYDEPKHSLENAPVCLKGRDGEHELSRAWYCLASARDCPAGPSGTRPDQRAVMNDSICEALTLMRVTQRGRRAALRQ